ncbi:hypothetical protein ACRRTK_003500 [Alexandromys fortis]
MGLLIPAQAFGRQKPGLPFTCWRKLAQGPGVRRWRFCFVPVKEEQTLVGDENADEALERTGQVERALSLEPAAQDCGFPKFFLEVLGGPDSPAALGFGTVGASGELSRSGSLDPSAPFVKNPQLSVPYGTAVTS